MTLANAQLCLSRKQNRDSRERKKNRKRVFFVSERHAVTLDKAQPCLSRKKNRDFCERQKKRVFSRKKKFPEFFLIEKLRKTGRKPKRRKPPEKTHLKSRKRVWKNKKIKSEGSVQSATRGEWLRARQVALIVARLPKERSLISCSRNTSSTSLETRQPEGSSAQLLEILLQKLCLASTCATSLQHRKQ